MVVRECDEDRASGLLWEAGTRGVEVRPAPRGRLELLAYFDEAPGLRERLAAHLASLDELHLEPAGVPEIDWLARVRESFRAFDIGPFQIRPSWNAADPPSGRVILVVDPGRAFGTGSHETTRLCLQAVAESTPGARVLDVGAGSGLLGVAALKLGALSATAVDLDAEAVASARCHARLNGVPLQIVHGDGGRPFAAAAFDVVLANLSASLLLERRDELLRLPRPEGRLILSGFLHEDFGELRAAYAPAGRLAAERREGEWAALLLGPARRS